MSWLAELGVVVACVWSTGVVSGLAILACRELFD